MWNRLVFKEVGLQLPVVNGKMVKCVESNKVVRYCIKTAHRLYDLTPQKYFWIGKKLRIYQYAIPQLRSHWESKTKTKYTLEAAILIVHEKYVNTEATDAMVHCVARASAALVLTISIPFFEGSAYTSC